jgi:hypothetical protein
MDAVRTCRPELRQGVIPYGNDVSWERLDQVAECCSDCGVTQGSVHHVFCSVAICGDCNERRLMCACDEQIDLTGPALGPSSVI